MTEFEHTARKKNTLLHFTFKLIIHIKHTNNVNKFT